MRPAERKYRLRDIVAILVIGGFLLVRLYGTGREVVRRFVESPADQRSFAGQWRLASMSADDRYRRVLGRFFGARSAILEHVPPDTEIGTFCDPAESRLMLNLDAVIYPRRLVDGETMRRRFIEHPEELDRNVYVLDLVKDWSIPMQEYFDVVASDKNFVLLRYRGRD